MGDGEAAGGCVECAILDENIALIAVMDHAFCMI